MVLSEILIILFLWMGIAVALKAFERCSAPPCSWDITILTFASGYQNSWLNRIFLILTLLGSVYLLLPISILIVWEFTQSGRTGEACLLALSFNGTVLIANLTKYSFKRKRPNLFPPLMEHHDPSYPSAHSAQIVAFIAPLLPVINASGIQQTHWLIGTAVFIVTMVAFSRIYLQVHYPSDVIAGIMLALLWFISVEQLLGSLGIRSK